MLYYLPGCTTSRNHLDAGRKMRNYMKAQGAKYARCCKLDTSYFRDGDILVQACTQCDFIMKERCPNIRVMSIYEYVMQDAEFPWANFDNKLVTVQDCFRTREDAALQDTVRHCLRNMNINFVEVKENHSDTRFCGVWLNNPAAEDCVAVAPEAFKCLEPYREILTPEQQVARMQEWNKQYTTDETVVYCNGCEKGIRMGGGKPLHLIELLAAGL